MITLEEAARYHEELTEVLREDAHNEERILKRLDQIRTQSGLQVYAALLLMAFLCSGLITLLFRLRDRLLSWQKGLVRW